MASARVSEARLRQIKKRQWVQRWGRDYLPALRASPSEAPTCSMPSVLHPSKLDKRSFHLMSQNEVWIALLLLYHPGVWDVHEQRVLFPNPMPHPLDGHQRAQGQVFPRLKGTVDVATRLGVLSRHPRCRVTIGDTKGMAWFPFTGDLLAFVQDADGPYSVNFSVKDRSDAFRKRTIRTGKPIRKHDELDIVHRHALEQAYYADAGIPTRRVIGADIDFELRNNLLSLFKFDGQQTCVSTNAGAALIEYFRRHVGTTWKAYELIHHGAKLLSLDPSAVHVFLMQSIWNREIEVDMFSPILIDRPLKRPSRDPIEVHKNWFDRM